MYARKLRDAVHKDIRLTARQVAALDTPQMQRLRGIRQLGAAYYVYPSAQHTRFEHCLGASWMAARIVDQIEMDGSYRFSPVEREAVCLASLVHDVTHIPFGHTFEDERRLLERHDRSARRYRILLGDGELADALQESEGGRIALELLKPGQEPPAGRRHLQQIVSGTICADLLDYLKRDNYFCGLSYEFDDRVFHYFRVRDGVLALDLAQGGYFRPDALSEITNLLRIRYVLSERVYYHHAKIAAGVIVSKAVERALELGLDEPTLCRLTDEALLYHLDCRYGDDRVLSELVSDFRSRRLYKRCYMLSRAIGEEAVGEMVASYHFNEDDARGTAERRIAEAVGAEEHQVALYCAPAGMALKEADVPVTMPGGRMGVLSELNSDEIQVLKRQHQALWRLYAFVSPRCGRPLADVSRACEEAIGLPNEMPPGKVG